MKIEVLFILKQKHLYGNTTYSKHIQSGLFNSATFVCQMLNEKGIRSELVQVIDNNSIDREVHKFKPKHVIIEALWVVPEKFEILAKLHPNVMWTIRLHSELPFLANEGSAMGWLFEYEKLAKAGIKIRVAPNTEKMFHDLSVVGIKHQLLLPNYYPSTASKPHCINDKHVVNIGCFGAIRPMKNQLIQAVAAIEFANRLGKRLNFHINSERVEKGDSALKNIRAVFDNHPEHKLIEHPWYPHNKFIHVVKSMDLGMQMSFNETFNIVAADFATSGVPIVASKEISWLSSLYVADPTSVEDMVCTLNFAYRFRKIGLHNLNVKGLQSYSNKSKKIWVKTFHHH